MVRRRSFTIRIIEEQKCSEGPTCPTKFTVDEDPDHTYFIYDTRIDPGIAAQVAHRVAPHEAIGKVPNQVAEGR